LAHKSNARLLFTQTFTFDILSHVSICSGSKSFHWIEGLTVCVAQIVCSVG